jgi:hypothetical protein
MMPTKIVKNALLFFTLAISAVYLQQFCHSKTDGFALYKICSSLHFHPEWETKPLASHEKERIVEILNQPFYYLAKGAQSYVFASADGQTVIKFFRLYHLTPPPWITAFAFPMPLMPYKLRKILSKRQELDKDFQSYKIAFEEMKEETGLIYIHLNKTKHFQRQITIYDKIGIAHQLDIDKMEFLVQKKATLVYPSIDLLMQTRGPETTKEAISALLQLLWSRCQKGIFDKDPDLNTNFGFLGTVPVQIDIGRFRKQQELKTPLEYRDEVIRITDHFRQWLDQKYPELSKHLLNEIHQLVNQ